MKIARGEGDTMTGFYVRVCREGHWDTAEIDELTDDELERMFADLSRDKAAGWAIVLAKWIRDTDRIRRGPDREAEANE
jgi:hypothetical protein